MAPKSEEGAPKICPAPALRGSDLDASGCRRHRAETPLRSVKYRRLHPFSKSELCVAHFGQLPGDDFGPIFPPCCWPVIQLARLPRTYSSHPPPVSGAAASDAGAHARERGQLDLGDWEPVATHTRVLQRDPRGPPEMASGSSWYFSEDRVVVGGMRATRPGWAHRGLKHQGREFLQERRSHRGPSALSGLQGLVARRWHDALG